MTSPKKKGYAESVKDRMILTIPPKSVNAGASTKPSQSGTPTFTITGKVERVKKKQAAFQALFPAGFRGRNLSKEVK